MSEEMLNAVARHLNALNDAAVRYLTDQITKDQFVNECLNLSDGKERRHVAALINAELLAQRNQRLAEAGEEFERGISFTLGHQEGE